MIIPGGSLLLHIGKPLGVGRSWLLPHGLLSVRRHERLGSVAVGLYRGEIHRYLSSHEGAGDHYLAIKFIPHPKNQIYDHAHTLKCFQVSWSWSLTAFSN